MIIFRNKDFLKKKKKEKGDIYNALYLVQENVLDDALYNLSLSRPFLQILNQLPNEDHNRQENQLWMPILCMAYLWIEYT